MATYQIDVATDDGIATVYTDDIAAFARQFQTPMSENPNGRTQCQDTFGEPSLEGYEGPFCGAATATGVPVITYRTKHALTCANL